MSLHERDEICINVSIVVMSSALIYIYMCVTVKASIKVTDTFTSHLHFYCNICTICNQGDKAKQNVLLTCMILGWFDRMNSRFRLDIKEINDTGIP